MVSTNTLANNDAQQYARPVLNQAVRLSWELSDPNQLAGVQDVVASAMEKLNYYPRDQYAVQMGLQETVFNAFEHGNSMCPTKKVYVTATICDNKCWFQIEDEGAGFDVENVPDPTLPENLTRLDGRGIYMMKAFLDSVEYQSPGNVVTISKQRTIEN
ncbi:anti-sigma F factor [Symmachiella dynata]|uniref:Anti-sigma F factor n=1 Tax=Symmachiella dynata TaxID=2527995 RepID=A0A517ZVJ7_9PLAN|nr:ATP-binding protein [Symmachiella dynata]QDU46475.1 anti-sigma F factor [Symmachiella dynata]